MSGEEAAPIKTGNKKTANKQGREARKASTPGGSQG
jgi:hypothetical protein